MISADRLLIVTYDMIPYTLYWGGCQRMYFLADHLVSGGWDVSVAHSRKSLVGDFGKPIRFRAIPIAFRNPIFRKIVERKSELLPASGGTRSGRAGLFTEIAEKILRKVDHLVYNEPNPGMGLISRAWADQAGADIVQWLRDSGVFRVVISGPPFGTFALAGRIKKEVPNSRIVLEYRDPWNLWNNRSGWTALWEARALSFADRIVVTNDPSREALAAKFHVSSDRIAVIPNGYSESDWSGVPRPEKRDDSRLVISYVGSINFGGYRDTDVLFRTLERFPDRKKILLRFVGVTPSDKSREWQKRLPEIVEFQQKIPHRDSLLKMVDSDILLQIHTTDDQSSKYLVSAKVYDYIRSGRPVWSLGGELSLNSRLVGDHGFGIVSANTESAITDALQGMIRLRAEGRLDSLRTNRSDVSVYSREYQNARYAELLRSL